VKVIDLNGPKKRFNCTSCGNFIYASRDFDNYECRKCIINDPKYKARLEHFLKCFKITGFKVAIIEQDGKTIS